MVSEASLPKAQANAELECERPDQTPDPINRGNDHEAQVKGAKKRKQAKPDREKP